MKITRKLVEEVSTPVRPLRPALASIKGALAYLGNIGPSKFYADILPELEVVKLGNRTFVTVASLDRLIAAHRLSEAEAIPVRAPYLRTPGISASSPDAA